MRLLTIFLVASTLAASAQKAAPSVQASSSGVCSPNILSNKGPVTITCRTAMDKATVTKIVSLLNQIVDRQNSSNEINTKLDSIMEFLQSNLNPNKARTTYNCAGTPTITTSTPNTSLGVYRVTGSPTEDAFQRMTALNNDKKNTELLALATEQITAAPDWITPYLFAAVAHGALGHREKAKEALRYYEQRTGPAYEDDPRCKMLSDFLRSHLQP